MTTLPSTSSYRLPRTPGSGGPPLPPGGAAAPAAAGPTAPVLTPADIWRIIRGNLWLIVASVAIAVAIGIGIYSYLKATDPKYRSVGQMVVNRPFYTNPGGRNANNDISMQDFDLPIEQHTQVQQLLQESLWGEVIEKNTVVRNTSWFKKIEDKARRTGTPAQRLAKDDLAANLSSSDVSGTKLITLSMDCANSQDAHDIVQAIGDAHIENQRQQSYDRTSSELESAKQWQSQLRQKITTLRDHMTDLSSRSASGSSPAEANRFNYKEMEMSNLIGMGTKARMEADEADGSVKAIDQQIKDGKDPVQVEAIVRNDPIVSRLRDSINSLELDTASQIRNGDASPAIKDTAARLTAFKQKLDKEEANARGIARQQVIESSKSDAFAKKAESASIDARIDQLKTELGEISANLAEYAGLKDEMDDYKEQERSTGERVEVLKNAVRQQVASCAWNGTPTKPEALSSPNLRVILPVAVMLGLAFSLGVAFLREMADTSVRSPRDITRVGPMNVLGMVSRESDDPELSGVPLHEVIVTAPTSLLAEQLRQVRTRLQHAISLDTTRTLLITSPGPGDGKTSIAANLAAGLALNGRRILLVDANFHRPALAALFKVPNEQGFSNVLENPKNLESVVHKTATANLELLTTGPRPTNPTELLESPLFTDFIDRALEEYDHVLFDGGPLLVVSEAVALAPRVDGVVTVIRAKKNTRGMLSRVKDTLKQTKAEHVGVILNGVQNVGGGYYARTIKTYYDYQGVR